MTSYAAQVGHTVGPSTRNPEVKFTLENLRVLYPELPKWLIRPRCRWYLHGWFVLFPKKVDFATDNSTFYVSSESRKLLGTLLLLDQYGDVFYAEHHHAIAALRVEYETLERRKILRKAYDLLVGLMETMPDLMRE